MVYPRALLGPLLFVLFINDLPLHVSSDLYAGDTTLNCSVNWMDMDPLQTSLNAAVSETVHWATANKLPPNELLPSLANVFPTEFLMTLFFSVNGSQLENLQCAKLLCLEIDKELTFHSHVDNLCENYSSELEF